MYEKDCGVKPFLPDLNSLDRKPLAKKLVQSRGTSDSAAVSIVNTFGVNRTLKVWGG